MQKVSSYTKSRKLDYQYDPLYTFSNEKDYYKAGQAAAKKNIKYVIRPIFYSMFSTLPNVPRYKLVMTKSATIEPFSKKTSLSSVTQNASVHTDYMKFFNSPLSKTNELPEIKLPKIDAVQNEQVCIKRKKNRKIQTRYRESSAQTSPWEPNFVVTCEEKESPELLKLNFLKWGSGLPCGAHEVILIQRARMKREWEKNLPACDTSENIAKRTALITEMERDEYAFREQEIQEIQDLRLHLLELMLQELHNKSHERSENKLRKFCEAKQIENNEKLAKIRKVRDRESRRLASNYTGLITKYRPVNIIDEYINKGSERYAPIMRHGENPKRWHQVIDEHRKLYQTKFRDVHKFGVLPKWLYDATKIDADNLKLPGTRLCIRETKWTAPVLKNLHESLKDLNKHIRKRYSLRVKIDREAHRITTPEVDSITDAEEELHQAAVLIQSIIRGRATQKLIYNGRERCNELIQELKSTQALLKREKERIFTKKVEVLYQQREHELCNRSALRIKEGLKKIQGSVIGTILDFLSKELRRLLDERKAHAMCLLYDRERQIREATEAHRRQLELRRRLEHDEIFKQVIKVHQDTVDLYLQDIVTEGMEFSSEEDAKLYVERLAMKIDEGMDTMEKSTEDDEQELVADLVHNFVLPEVQKQYVRDKIKKKQAKYLQTVHDCIYTHVEHLPKIPKHLSEGVEFLDEHMEREAIKGVSIELNDHRTTAHASILKSKDVKEKQVEETELEVITEGASKEVEEIKKAPETSAADEDDGSESREFAFDTEDAIFEEFEPDITVSYFNDLEEHSEEEDSYEY